MAKLGGWWRLWIAVTGVYGLLVFLVLALEQWPTAERVEHHPSFIYRMSADARETLIRTSTTGLLEQMLLVADKKGDVPLAKRLTARILEQRSQKGIVWDPLQLEMVNGYIFEVVSDTPMPDADRIGKEYTAVLQDELQAARLRRIGQGFAFWLVPMLVMCALGLLGRWVYQGFKKA